FEEPRDAIQLGVTLFFQVLVGTIRGRCAPSTATATAAAAETRELEGHPDRRRHRALFPRVTIEIHHRGLASEQAAGRRGDDGRHAIGARDGDGVAVVVERNLSAQLRVEIEDLVRVAEIPCAGVLESDRRLRVDEARIDLRARRVDDLRAGWDADGCTDAFDDA